MRLLLVNSHGADREFGGAERYVRDLATGARARGHDVTVLSAFPPRDPGDLETRVLHDSDWREDRGRRVANQVGDLVAAPWPRLAEALRDVEPDLVHTGNLPGIGTGVWEVARRIGVPVVHTPHDYYLLCRRATLTRRSGRPCSPRDPYCRLRARRLGRWAPGVGGVIAASEHVLALHRDLFPSAHAAVIRHPIVPAPGFEAQQVPEAGPATLGYIGSLSADKGVEVLLAAAPRLAARGVAVRIAGDGPLRARVEGAAGVDYAGLVKGDAKERFLRSCGVGIVPSLWDEPGGPPYVVGEWLAARRPVIVACRGGLAEAVALGGVEAIAPEPDAIVDAVSGLLDPGAYARRVAAIPERRGDADRERWLDEHEAIYRAVLAEAPR